MDELETTATAETTETPEATIPDTEVITLLREVLGTLANMQQALDAQVPVEPAAEEVVSEEALLEEGPDTTGGTIEPSPDPEEVDKLLHED